MLGGAYMWGNRVQSSLKKCKLCPNTSSNLLSYVLLPLFSGLQLNGEKKVMYHKFTESLIFCDFVGVLKLLLRFCLNLYL